MTVIAEVEAQIAIDQAKYGDYASLHEGYGVLAEEFAEFFEAVRMRQSDPRRTLIARQELIQIAAIAVRMAGQAARLVR